MATAIMTDSNSGITAQEAERIGVALAAMPFLVNGETYHEGVDLPRDQFFQLLRNGASVSTSQVEPGSLIRAWENLLLNHDGVVYIPMSSGLSGSCVTAAALASGFNGRVQVVDNHRISVTQRQSVYDAVGLAQEGRTALEIKEALEADAYYAGIYIAVDTLEYLRKGGRLSGAESLVGTVLQIKPVLQISGEKLVPFRKVRGMKAARKVMVEAMLTDAKGLFRDFCRWGEMQLMVSYSDVSDEVRDSWLEEVAAAFPGLSIVHAPLALSICCHTGPVALGIGMCHFHTPTNG